MLTLKYKVVSCYMAAIISCSFLLLSMHSNAVVTRSQHKNHVIPTLAEASDDYEKKAYGKKQITKSSYFKNMKLNELEIDLTKSAMQWLELQDSVINSVAASQKVEVRPNCTLDLVNYIVQKMMSEDFEPLMNGNATIEKEIFFSNRIADLASVTPYCPEKTGVNIMDGNFFKSMVVIILLYMKREVSFGSGNNKLIERLTELFDDDSLALKNRRYIAYLKSLITNEYIEIDNMEQKGIQCLSVNDSERITFLCRDKGRKIYLNEKGSKIISEKANLDVVAYYSIKVSKPANLVNRDPAFFIMPYLEKINNLNVERNYDELSAGVCSYKVVSNLPGGLIGNIEKDDNLLEVTLGDESPSLVASFGEETINTEDRSKKSVFSVKNLASKSGRLLKAIIPNTGKQWIAASIALGAGAAALYQFRYGGQFFTYAVKNNYL